MPKVLAYEGGYSNHPDDPGGVTLEGVIQRVYDGYRTRKGLPQKELTAGMRSTAAWKRERDEIYRTQYWDACRCDELPPGIDFVVFDGAVNSGVSQSSKWLQRALGVPADGHIGAATIAAANAHMDHDELVADICARRMAFLQQLRTWPTFGKGWAARVSSVRSIGQAWASGAEGPEPVRAAWFDQPGDAKASPADVSDAPVSVGKSASVTTGAGVAAELTDKLQNVTATLEPVSNTLKVVQYILTAVAVVSAGILLYGIYRSWKAQRALNGEDVAAVPE